MSRPRQAAFLAFEAWRGKWGPELQGPFVSNVLPGASLHLSTRAHLSARWTLRFQSILEDLTDSTHVHSNRRQACKKNGEFLPQSQTASISLASRHDQIQTTLSSPTTVPAHLAYAQSCRRSRWAAWVEKREKARCPCTHHLEEAHNRCFEPQDTKPKAPVQAERLAWPRHVPLPNLTQRLYSLVK